MRTRAYRGQGPRAGAHHTPSAGMPPHPYGSGAQPPAFSPSRCRPPQRWRPKPPRPRARGRRRSGRRRGNSETVSDRAQGKALRRRRLPRSVPSLHCATKPPPVRAAVFRVSPFAHRRSRSPRISLRDGRSQFHLPKFSSVSCPPVPTRRGGSPVATGMEPERTKVSRVSRIR